jgi:hypothetical protein
VQDGEGLLDGLQDIDHVGTDMVTDGVELGKVVLWRDSVRYLQETLKQVWKYLM